MNLPPVRRVGITKNHDMTNTKQVLSFSSKEIIHVASTVYLCCKSMTCWAEVTTLPADDPH